MAHTFHGHHIPGSTERLIVGEPVGCGGILDCPRCKAEVTEYNKLGALPFVPQNVSEDFQAKAKRILINYVDSHYSVAFEKPAFEVYIVWFAKVLQHWKALVCTDQPDKKYFELTYNGDLRVTYVDEYGKINNVTVPD